ncbi:MAG: GNAT family N-acetyltransferase [Solirubrobacteraceae bacterium]
MVTASSTAPYEVSIAVAEDMRGRGIGTALLEILIEHARREDIAALSLSAKSTTRRYGSTNAWDSAQPATSATHTRCVSLLAPLDRPRTGDRHAGASHEVAAGNVIAAIVAGPVALPKLGKRSDRSDDLERKPRRRWMWRGAPACSAPLGALQVRDCDRELGYGISLRVQTGAGRDHGRAAGADGVHDLAGIDATRVDARDAEACPRSRWGIRWWMGIWSSSALAGR